MSILVVSPHEESAAPLCSALERRKIPFEWMRELPATRGNPLVAVVDSKLEGFRSVLRALKAETPWCRRYVMDPPKDAALLEGSAALHLPFDASVVAERIGKDRELALLDRKRLELEVEAQDLGELLQNSFEAFIGLSQDLRIVSFSPGASEMYGYRAVDVLGRHISLLGETAAEETLAADAGDPKQTRVVREVARRGVDGRELRVLVSRSRCPRVVPGSKLAFTEVSLDVTPLRRLEQQLEHQARLAHVGRIAATMSHEINNPLAVIRSCAAWLASFAERTDSAELQETSRDLELASERIATFVRQMTGFVRRAGEDRRLEPLAGTLEMALRMVRPRAANKNVLLALVDATGATVPVQHDASRFAHAIINVVANAIDAAADGGGHVWIWISATPKEVLIKVEDDGRGIDPSMQGRLFEPFATTKSAGQGTGLGLALTHEIVREHAGTVSLGGREGGGARAEIHLPRGAEPQKAGHA